MIRFRINKFRLNSSDTLIYSHFDFIDFLILRLIYKLLTFAVDLPTLCRGAV